ncbi:MAG: AsmA family protein [Rhizobiales bacterium]|nr:AsmA family protein [Hyphomicrobiales bacterium]
MKTVKFAGAAIAAIILVIAIVLAVGIPSGMMTSAIQARIERATGYRIEIDGKTRIALWPTFHVTLNNISLDRRAGTDDAERIEIVQARVEMPLANLISGKPVITDLALEKPVAYLPLLRERTASKSAPASNDTATTPTSDTTQVRIDRVSVTDGALVFANARDKVEDRVEAINATATIGADLQLAINATARSGDHALKLDLRAELPNDAAARRNLPVELTFEAPSLMSDSLTAKADVRLAGPVVRINGVSGTLGGKPFTGWASVDLAGKPLVKLDLDIQDLAFGKPTRTATQASATWSDVPFDLRGLNYVDADVRISAARLAYDDLRVAPLALGATLNHGTLAARFENVGIYEGFASGALTLDASAPMPRLTLQGDLAGIRALPLLSGLADFDRLKGKLQAKFAVQSSGDNPRAMMSNLEGTAFLDFRDGKIRGINVAQMIRSLTTGTLNGWQSDEVQATDLSQLSASFRIARGKAETSDIVLTGPLVRMRGGGTIDLGGKALALRVEPKLVMSLEGQGSAADPVGLGIPVMIQGPWAAPRIYPDMAGILDNPDAAYARLRELGQGLFGTDPNNKTGKSLGETLGGMIQQGLGSPPQQAAPAPDKPDAPGGTDAPSAIDGILKQLFGR